jgi:hypothetical protein
MNERRRIEEKLRRKEQEIQTLEDRIKETRVYIQALQDVLKIMPKSPEMVTLRHGSAVARAREIIMRAGRPVHISAILEELGKDVTRAARSSITSSLAAYVRKGEVFTRTGPNTYGLAELGHVQVENSREAQSEPPTGFGEVRSTVPEGDDTPF